MKSSLELGSAQASDWGDDAVLGVLGNPIGVSAEVSLIRRIAFWPNGRIMGVDFSCETVPKPCEPVL